MTFSVICGFFFSSLYPPPSQHWFWVLLLCWVQKEGRKGHILSLLECRRLAGWPGGSSPPGMTKSVTCWVSPLVIPGERLNPRIHSALILGLTCFSRNCKGKETSFAKYPCESFRYVIRSCFVQCKHYVKNTPLSLEKAVLQLIGHLSFLRCSPGSPDGMWEQSHEFGDPATFRRYADNIFLSQWTISGLFLLLTVNSHMSATDLWPKSHTLKLQILTLVV
jgi:hypothetical protein